MSAEDEDYYQRRIREEREAEKAAPTKEIAQVHAELAAQYEVLLHKLPKTPKP
ncbi:MAG: hypothetical protein V4530_03690 [Pseudomonadota bacterium]